MKNPVIWFEIATTDIERAKEFYSAVFKCKLQYLEMPDSKMYMFDADQGEHGISGALVQGAGSIPSSEGSIVYFNCADVSTEVSRIEGAGGKVVFPKMSIGEFGFIAQFTDTEGNIIGLHSMT